MGRSLLILFLLLAACRGGEQRRGGGPPEPAESDIALPVSDGAGHRGMACNACHSGPSADFGRASVPRATCMAAGCHPDGGPERVRTGTISFPHRGHGQTGAVHASCAGCHDHHSGNDALHVEVGACALCHVSAMSGDRSTDCKMCHDRPEHVALTNQSVPIPHGALPWVETGCVRCHYDVAEPLVRVSIQKCAACHADLDAVTADGIGADLHPAHSGLGCLSCHQEGAHRVVAMSSAVSLVCSDCHTVAHGLRLPQEYSSSLACSFCHQRVHQAQQRLVLGLVDESSTAAPSAKFMAGLTCRSCHIPRPSTDTAVSPIRGQAQACADCHRDEYRRVLGWWIQGTRARTSELLDFTARATTDLANAPDTARALVGSARAMVELVAQAGGQHNLELADRIFREARDRVLTAYRLAGRAAPPAPDLGTAAHQGLCSYCHYAPNDAWNYRRMPADFHEQVLGQQQRER